MKLALFFFIFSYSFSCVAQNDIKDEYTFDFKQVFESDTIVYYGIDFSNFGLYNPEKISQEDGIMKFFPVWMSSVHEAYAIDDMQAILKKEVKKDFQPVQNRFKLIRDEWIGFENHTFETQKIKEIVKEYVLDEVSGIGLVLIIENFNKEKEHARVNFTFFNIATREVLWSVEVKGEASGTGMTNHWANAIGNCFETFKLQYRSKLNEVKKEDKGKSK